MNKNLLNNLIRKYILGKISEEEKKSLDQEWNDSLDKNIFSKSLKNKKKEQLRKEVYQNITSQISANDEGPYFFKTRKKSSDYKEAKYLSFSSRSSLLKIASVFIGFLLISVLTYHFLNRSKIIYYSTAYGERLNLLLSDSSMVTLNSNSTIKFKENWKLNEDREIWLDGEAFFTVKHSQNHQEFKVYASDLEVKALGTKFNVNNRRGKPWVVLNSGLVLLNLQGTSEDLILNPGELAEYSIQENEYQKKVVDPEIYTSWVNQKLVFEKTSLRKIAEILEDNYGVEVIINDPNLADMTFSAVIPMEDLDIFLNILSEAFEINIRRQQNKIIFNNY
ncbi:FecR domain-containing protein [soil metagenome]